MISSLLRAARPHQWVKNLFVAAPLVFAQRMSDPAALVRTLIAVGSFCLISAAVYLLNDIVDVEKDRAHPTKKNRPIASGALPIGVARVAAVVAAIAGLGVGVWLSPLFAATGAAYLVQNIGYSFWLKKVPYFDVAVIALGFLLRVLAGAFALPVPPSTWLLVCTVLLSSLLGFGKRAHELRMAGERRAVTREVLSAYHPGVLKVLLLALAGLTTLAYAAYTVSEHALTAFGTRGLVLTVPFVAIGVFRFLWIAGNKNDAESPTDSMLRDRPFLLTMLLYVVSIVGVIYYRN